MNISQVMPNYKGRAINRKNSAILYRLWEQLPRNIVGGVSGLIRSDVLQLSKKIQNCGTSAVVAYNGTTEKAVEMSRCGVHKLCPVCADSVSGKRIKKIDQALKESYSSAQFAYMLTFTLKDGDDLDERVRTLNSSYRRWYLYGRKRERGFSLGEAAKITGLSKSLEIKIGQNSNEWHPHLHCITFSRTALDFRVYSESVRADFEKSKRNDFKKFMLENGGLLYPFADNTERLRDLYTDLYGSYNYHDFSMWRIEKGDSLVQMYNRGAGWLSFTGDSKISREWRIATDFQGQNLKVNVLYTDETRPAKYESFISSFEQKEMKFGGEKMAALKAVKYSLKYSVKPGDLEKMSPEQVFTLLDVMRKTRTIEFKGFLRGAAAENVPVLNYSPLYVENEPSEEMPLFDQPAPEENQFSEWREFMAAAAVGTYRTNTAKEDRKLEQFLKDQSEYDNFTPVALSDRERANLKEMLFMPEFNNLEMYDNGMYEVRKNLERQVFGVPKPEPVADEPRGEVSPARASEYFLFRPGDVVGDKSRVALYQLGADYHKIFHREVTRKAAQYRKQRAAAFECWKRGAFMNMEYINFVGLMKNEFKREVAELRAVRDRKIDCRSGGLYSMIRDSENRFKKRVESDFGVTLYELPPEKNLREMILDGKTASEKRRAEVVEAEQQEFF